MKSPLEELRKIIKMPDQKHWNATEMRERALEEWIYNWVEEIKYEQLVLNDKHMDLEFQDFIKEHVAKKLSEQQLEECVDFVKKKNSITGKVVCIRRKARE